jgi:hypothetical protein
MDRYSPVMVLVTDMAVNWEPVMKRASAIVTNQGSPLLPRRHRHCAQAQAFRQWWAAAARH